MDGPDLYLAQWHSCEYMHTEIAKLFFRKLRTYICTNFSRFILFCNSTSNDASSPPTTIDDLECVLLKFLSRLTNKEY